MRPVILIPARYAASRLPGKPLADIHGKPMILHVFERAMASGAGEVAVATDDERIHAVIEAAGGKSVLTRADHPSGSDRIHEALQILDPQARFDTIINVQGDLPTLDPALISLTAAPLAHPGPDIATLAAEIKDESEKQDAAVVKVVLSASCLVPREHLQAKDKSRGTNHEARTTSAHRALYFSRALIPTGPGPHYHHIGLYAYRREALARFVALPPSPLEIREKLEQLRALENGMRIDVSVADTVPLGVDTPETLEKARNFYANAI